MQWWEKDSDLYEDLKKNLLDFPALIMSIELNRAVVLTGEWHVYGKERLITTYNVRIVLPSDFPKGVPLVYEVGGVIPQDADHHINPDGTACLFAPPERWEKWPEGASIAVFLNGPVRDFFFSQAFYERTGQWPFGEWSHGDVGVIEYYFEKLGTSSFTILEGLVQLSQYHSPSRQWRCPCGNNKRYKECHWRLMEPLIKGLPRSEWEYLKSLITIVNSEAEKTKNKRSSRSLQRPLRP